MMAMDDPRRLAATFVLGTLDGAERAEARARRADDPDFAALVHLWEERLAPLHALSPAVRPPADLWDDLLAALPVPTPEVEEATAALDAPDEAGKEPAGPPGAEDGAPVEPSLPGVDMPAPEAPPDEPSDPFRADGQAGAPLEGAASSRPEASAPGDGPAQEPSAAPESEMPGEPPLDPSLVAPLAPTDTSAGPPPPDGPEPPAADPVAAGPVVPAEQGQAGVASSDGPGSGSEPDSAATPNHAFPHEAGKVGREAVAEAGEGAATPILVSPSLSAIPAEEEARPAAPVPVPAGGATAELPAEAPAEAPGEAPVATEARAPVPPRGPFDIVLDRPAPTGREAGAAPPAEGASEGGNPWRLTTGLLLVAGLIGGGALAYREMHRQPPLPDVFAPLRSSPHPQMVLALDPEAGDVVVRHLDAPPPDGMVYRMWLVSHTHGTRAVCSFTTAGRCPAGALGAVDRAGLMAGTLQVTLEPAGLSLATPTGKVVFYGRALTR